MWKPGSLFSKLAVPFVLAAISGCGSDSGPTNAPGNPPPGEQPGTAPSWSEVFFEQMNDAVAPTDCDYPHKFRLHPDGTFHAGPCERNGAQEVTGALTASEQTALDARVETIVRNDLSRPPECDSSGAIASSRVDLTLNSGQIYSVFDTDPGSNTCYRGGKQAAQDLRDYVVQLKNKYYPTRG